MTEQWQELKETITELRDNDGTGTQQEVCKFLANLMDVLEKQMQEPCEDAISRQALINKAVSWDKHFADSERYVSLTDIQNAPSVNSQEPSWIPVSERLPEQYKEVIVTDIETSDTYLSRYIGNGYWECDNGLFNYRIIAWQPKPQPYKAERNENAK